MEVPQTSSGGTKESLMTGMEDKDVSTCTVTVVIYLSF